MAISVPDVGEVEMLKRLLYGRGQAITGATNATPIVVTSNGHGLTLGTLVIITDVLGNTAANGTFVVCAITANTFALYSISGTTLSAVAGNGAYTSGGFWNLASLETWTLKLFKASVTPAEGDTAGTYTEADFTNYVSKTLASKLAAAGWAVPTTSTGVTSSQHTSGTPLSWTCGASGNTVYGYYVVGADSTILIYSEAFSSSKSLSSGDSLSFTPKLQLD